MDEDLLTLVEPGLSEASLQQMRVQAQTAHLGKFDRELIDRKKGNNPYESLYKERWIEVIKKTTYMKKFVSVRDFAMHMSVESDNLMVGTEHEGEAKWKHDAMVLLTAKETIEWMRTTMLAERSLLSRWLQGGSTLGQVAVPRRPFSAGCKD